jgi:hypothetical protein
VNSDQKTKRQIVNIKNAYLDLVSDKSIGGSQPLKRLARKIWEGITGSPPEYSVPLFVLYRVLMDIAIQQDEGPVTIDECKRLYLRLHDSILKIILDVENSVGASTLLKDCADLIEAQNIQHASKSA